jgi:hypothetical protein
MEPLVPLSLLFLFIYLMVGEDIKTSYDPKDSEELTQEAE